MNGEVDHIIDESEQCGWCGNFKCCIDAELVGGVRDDGGRLFCSSVCLEAFEAGG